MFNNFDHFWVPGSVPVLPWWPFRPPGSKKKTYFFCFFYKFFNVFSISSYLDIWKYIWSLGPIWTCRSRDELQPCLNIINLAPRRCPFMPGECPVPVPAGSGSGRFRFRCRFWPVPVHAGSGSKTAGSRFPVPVHGHHDIRIHIYIHMWAPDL